MKRKTLAISIGWICAALPLAAVDRVAVAVLPLVQMVQFIAGEAIEVRSLQQEGDACGVFEARPSILHWLSGADLFFRTGVGYEDALLNRLQSQNPRLQVVDLRSVVPPLGTALAATDAAHAASGCTHCASCASHSGHELALDPHLWLDPLRMALQAEAVAQALAAKDPAHADEFIARAAEFRRRAEALHATLEAQLSPHAGKAFYVYHPALGYFSERYGIRQLAIAADSNGPSPRALRRIIEEARTVRIRTVFVQPQESQRQAEILAHAIGAEVVSIDPLALDWEHNLRRIGSALATAFAEQ